MLTLVIVLHMLAAGGIITLVLLQHGKGADMGAAFGSGSAGSLFGSAGAANFLSRSTAVLAVLFFATSLILTYLSAPKKGGGVIQQLENPVGGSPLGDRIDSVKPAAPAPSAPAPAAPKDTKSQEIPK
jgi:preprotein translocase subunit SecG